jgi:hypothetical protein
MIPFNDNMFNGLNYNIRYEGKHPHYIHADTDPDLDILNLHNICLHVSVVDPNPKESEGFGGIRIRKRKKFGFGFRSRNCYKIKIIPKIRCLTLEREPNVCFLIVPPV